jgi:hypothetical protein
MYSPYNSAQLNYELNTSNPVHYNTYSNNNYEMIDPTTNASNLILIKQTNDIYFNSSNNINNNDNNIVYQLPPPPSLAPPPPVSHPKNLKTSKSKLRPPPENQIIHETNKLSKKTASPSNVITNRKVRSKSRLTSPIPVKVKSNDSTKKSTKKLVNKSEKSSSGAIAASGFLKPFNTNNEKKFHRNTDHTQSIKLIKENFANLFLSKKSSSNNNNNNNEQSKQIYTVESELMRTIEIETNKNMLTKQKSGESIDIKINNNNNNNNNNIDNSKSLADNNNLDMQSRFVKY